MPSLTQRVHFRLWLKIWLSVLLVVFATTLLASLGSRFLGEPPIREVVARNPMGAVVAHGRTGCAGYACFRRMSAVTVVYHPH